MVWVLVEVFRRKFLEQFLSLLAPTVAVEVELKPTSRCSITNP